MSDNGLDDTRDEPFIEWQEALSASLQNATHNAFLKAEAAREAKRLAAYVPPWGKDGDHS